MEISKECVNCKRGSCAYCPVMEEIHDEALEEALFGSYYGQE